MLLKLLFSLPKYNRLFVCKKNIIFVMYVSSVLFRPKLTLIKRSNYSHYYYQFRKNFLTKVDIYFIKTKNFLTKLYLSPLRKALLFYHKGHKVISQRAQSIKYQHISTCVLCAFFVYFVVENTFRSGLIF